MDDCTVMSHQVAVEMGSMEVTEVFRTDDVHSDYIETMIENRFGVKGGMRTLGANAVPIQYNMLLNKLTPSADNDSGRRYL